MAKVKKTKKTGTARRPVSLNPDNFQSYGLVDDVDVKIIGATYKPFNYNGASRVRDTDIPNHVGVAEITYEIDGEEKVDQISYGDLQYFAPSKDGETLAGGDDDDYIGLSTGDLEEPNEDMEGPYLLPVEHEGKVKRPELGDSTGFAFFLRSLKAAAEEAEIELPDTGNLEELLVGISGHVNRLKNDRLRGAAAEGKGGMVLVFTELETGPDAATGGSKKKGKKTSTKDEDEAPAKKAGKAGKGKTKPEPEPDEEEEEEDEAEDADDEFTDRVVEAVTSILERNGGTAKIQKLTSGVEAFPKRADKETYLDMIGDKKFLASRREWEYDRETKTLTASE